MTLYVIYVGLSACLTPLYPLSTLLADGVLVGIGDK